MSPLRPIVTGMSARIRRRRASSGPRGAVPPARSLRRRRRRGGRRAGALTRPSSAMSRLTVAWVTAKPRSRRSARPAPPGCRSARAATRSRIVRWRASLEPWPRSGGRRAAVGVVHGGPRRPAALPRPAVMRVPNVGSSSARASAARRGRVGDDGLGARASRARRARPGSWGPSRRRSTPAAISASASAAVSVASFVPSASRMPSTSVMRTSWRAPEAGGDAGRRVVGVDVADDPVLVAGERRHDRDLAADEDRVEEVALDARRRGRRSPCPGTRSATSRPPSTPDRPTASTPRSRSAATSSLLTTPRRTAAATSSAGRRSRAGRPRSGVGTPSRSSHSVIRLPPPWTRTTGRRRATSATSARTCCCSARVVPPSLRTRISLTSCTRRSR